MAEMERVVNGMDGAGEGPVMTVDSGQRDNTTTPSITIFISHSKQDEELAEAFVMFVHDVIIIDPSEIRCTSVPGYKLNISAHISVALRDELEGCSIVIGVITPNSIASAHVLFELGAAWSRQKVWAVLGNGVDYRDLPGHLGEYFAVKLSEKDGLMQLADEIAEKTGRAKKKVAMINRAADRFIKFIKSLDSGDVSNEE